LHVKPKGAQPSADPSETRICHRQHDREFFDEGCRSAYEASARIHPMIQSPPDGEGSAASNMVALLRSDRGGDPSERMLQVEPDRVFRTGP